MSIKKFPIVEILIPTYNRKNYLLDNLKILLERVKEEKMENFFRVIVSDNCSEDGTFEHLLAVTAFKYLNVQVFKQLENTGAEKNVLFLLSKSTTNFVMYLGDDDYIPSGYLTYVINKIRSDPRLGAIVPGFSSLYPDGTIEPARNASFYDKKFEPCLQSVMCISNYGHQMSGLVFRRDQLFQKYTDDAALRNMYPFIFFLAFNVLSWNSYYAPGYQVLVMQGNKKYWEYDRLGLLPDIFKNYCILFPKSAVSRIKCCLAFTEFQPWRLSIDRSVMTTGKAFFQFMYSSDIKVSIRIAFFPMYAKSMLKLISKAFGRRFFKFFTK